MIPGAYSFEAPPIVFGMRRATNSGVAPCPIDCGVPELRQTRLELGLSVGVLLGLGEGEGLADGLDDVAPPPPPPPLGGVAPPPPPPQAAKTDIPKTTTAAVRRVLNFTWYLYTR